MLWWGALNVFGPTRCRHFGTFSITSVGSQGSGILHVPTLLTSTLHYGMLDPDGGLEMRLSFDHRVLDGATAARALEDLETVLLGEILHECMGSV
jgi:pyruvate/2-oxoglutarate dehydrogenase complex dihydrolipoamide acyltransferase (E2) component